MNREPGSNQVLPAFEPGSAQSNQVRESPALAAFPRTIFTYGARNRESDLSQTHV